MPIEGDPAHPAEPAPARGFATDGAPPAEDRPMTRTYAAILAVEVAFLLALWAVGRFFGS